MQDTSPEFRQTRLYLEALLRSTPQTDDKKICVGHKAAMNPMPYQFDPAMQALSQTRSRILIADAVGIGKTLEAGILTSELIIRGRGKRILILATKAMLNQFQQEFWNRFTIPLVRLDSEGIQRVSNKLPTNHNPFLYFDRAIISIDTLKQSEYRDYLEKAYWDIIIIDEAHNVAVRSNRSQRANLATMLANRSDTLIMLSATPHDGRDESFASLLNMLDPMALTTNKGYSAKDFSEKGLVIRRFKHHIESQAGNAFQQREIDTVKATATPAEERVYDYLSTVRFSTLDRKNTSGAHLFATTLIKAMFSSPAACLSVIANRRNTLERNKTREGAAEDIDKLNELEDMVKDITDDQFSKLNLLVELLGNGPNSLGWNRDDPEDRMVIFTESVKTLEYLEKVLPKMCRLKKNQYRVMNGTMPDTQIAEVIREFNHKDNPIRLLICSDVASEGINLHHLSHRMIHFDIPWSLMTFQQRNGRIDRFGQKKQPQIRYLQTESKIEKCIGDVRILEKLIEKDKNAQNNIDDPREFLMTQQEQEDLTAARMEGREELEPWDEGYDPIAALLAMADAENESENAQSGQLSRVMPVDEYEALLDKPVRLYQNDMSYAADALRWMSRNESQMNAYTLHIDDHSIRLQAPPDLEARLKYLPSELLPENNQFNLTDDTDVMQKEITHASTQDKPWPAKQLLWPLHPVMTWINDKLVTIFGRHSAPVVPLANLSEGEAWVLIQGGFPNRRGYIPIHQWIAVHLKNGVMQAKELKDFFDATHFDKRISNPGQPVDVTQYKDMIQSVVNLAREKLLKARATFDNSAKKSLQEKVQELDNVRKGRQKQIEMDFAEAINKRKKEEAQNKLTHSYNSALRYIQDTAETEAEPYLQLVALFVGKQNEVNKTWH